MYNIRLQAPKLARKCEIKHWYTCGADGRKVGWSVYGHAIAEFSKMDRFSKLWDFELSPWSNKISAQNFKHYVTSMDRLTSPRYTQMDSLPNFLTHGAPLCARFARARSSAIRLLSNPVGRTQKTPFPLSSNSKASLWPDFKTNPNSCEQIQAINICHFTAKALAIHHGMEQREWHVENITWQLGDSFHRNLANGNCPWLGEAGNSNEYNVC